MASFRAVVAATENQIQLRVWPVASLNQRKRNNRAAFMVVYVLHITAELDNCTNLKPADAVPRFCVDLKDLVSDEVREGVWLSAADVVEADNSKAGSANLIMRWKDTKRDAVISVVQPKGVTRPGYNLEDSGKSMPWVVALDCRNCEPVKWHPEGAFFVQGSEKDGKSSWDDVDLRDEWTEYDERAALPVSVKLVSSSWERVKGM